jgi:phosphatidylethanolamine-binding protein (PEBP) family uncharacterized protein
MGLSGPGNWWHSENGSRRWRLRNAALLLATGALLLVDSGQAMALTLTSSAFAPGEKIPAKYTCEGDDLSPPLAFTGVPDGTKSLALIVDDPDVPDPKAPKRIWVHWVVFNLPPDAQGLPEDVSGSGLPSGAVTGLNDRKKGLLPRTLSADRTASLFSQALRARHYASGETAQQVRARSRHEGSCAGASGADRDLSEGRSVSRTHGNS